MRVITQRARGLALGPETEHGSNRTDATSDPRALCNRPAGTLAGEGGRK